MSYDKGKSVDKEEECRVRKQHGGGREGEEAAQMEFLRVGE